MFSLSSSAFSFFSDSSVSFFDLLYLGRLEGEAGRSALLASTYTSDGFDSGVGFFTWYACYCSYCREETG